MLRASNEYKEVMSRKIRPRGYATVSLGVINQESQQDATVQTEQMYYSKGDPFSTELATEVNYATFETDYVPADGSFLFLPTTAEEAVPNGLTFDFDTTVRIQFGSTYPIKGLTIDFGSAHPTSLTITTAERTETITDISSGKFVTNVTFGDTDFIELTANSMTANGQRLHIKSIEFGVGIAFSNTDIQNIQIASFVSSISEEVSYANYTISVFDTTGAFDVDNPESFMGYLDPMQPLNISFGVELDDGSIEWITVATAYLKTWDIKKKVLTMNATDMLSQLEGEYSHRVIETRTAYQCAVDVLTDAGFEPDDYVIDEYLQTITLVNPMPITTHRECLQTLANACRCIIYENTNNQIVIKANFANIINPENMVIESDSEADWSNAENLFDGATAEYAEFTLNRTFADGSAKILPTNGDYLNTAYVSDLIADADGKFYRNGVETYVGFTVTLPASFNYYGAQLLFGGNYPQELQIVTYNNDTVIETVTFNRLSKNSFLQHDFLAFNKFEVRITKGAPHNRVVINKFSFGEATDYNLTYDLMYEKPYGYTEMRVKDIRVKIYTYETDPSTGNVTEVNDEVYYTHQINPTGITKTVNNPLIHTTAHAQLVAEWLANYYVNNVSYSVNYRGEPRMQAGDVIHMQSDFKNNLQVEVQTNKLTFNGAWKGDLELRRALKATQI